MIRVLVVDDNETFREVAAAVVAMTDGFAVAGLVGTGETAVDAIRAGGIGLVLMDVHLPGLDGPAATELIRVSEVEPRPVVLLMSSYPAEEFMAAAIASGADGYLAKDALTPARLRALWHAVRAPGR